MEKELKLKKHTQIMTITGTFDVFNTRVGNDNKIEYPLDGTGLYMGRDVIIIIDSEMEK